jgi:hypothetical protein
VVKDFIEFISKFKHLQYREALQMKTTNYFTLLSKNVNKPQLI